MTLFDELKAGEEFILADSAADDTVVYIRINSEKLKKQGLVDPPHAISMHNGDPIWFPSRIRIIKLK